jgi:hypothetical protein
MSFQYITMLCMQGSDIITIDIITNDIITNDIMTQCWWCIETHMDSEQEILAQ